MAKPGERKGTWIGGLAEWQDGDTTYLSVAFTWKLDEAYSRALFAKALGRRVVAGGPALFLEKMRHELAEIAEIGKSYPDAIAKHNPMATIASRGCPGKGTEDNPDPCAFCIVPPMEGTRFTLLPEFPVRPILCDNNLSALDPKYQDYIIERYRAAGVPLLDANSGFEPLTFTPDVYERWKAIVNAGRGPWRFAYDESRERDQVIRVMKMLKDEPAKRKRVYVLIGNEPFAESMARIQEVIAHGCEPYVQPYMKLVALQREPHVRFDWTAQKLKDVARWANAFLWKRTSFDEYDRTMRKRPIEVFDGQQGLFTSVEAA